MKPYKVWNSNRAKKVTVVANSLEELMRKGTEPHCILKLRTVRACSKKYGKLNFMSGTL